MSLYFPGLMPRFIPFSYGEKVIRIYRKGTFLPTREVERIIAYGRINSISTKAIKKMATKTVKCCTYDTVEFTDGEVCWTSQVSSISKFREKLTFIKERGDVKSVDNKSIPSKKLSLFERFKNLFGWIIHPFLIYFLTFFGFSI